MTTYEKEMYNVLGFLKGEREKAHKAVEKLAVDLKEVVSYTSPNMIQTIANKISKYAELMKELDRQIANVVHDLEQYEKSTLQV